MKRLLTALALASATISAQAVSADEYFAVTPSGTTEAVFAGSTADAIAKLSSRCIDRRWQVISSSNTSLVCEAPLSSGQSIVGQLLMGNSYSTPPRRFIQFNAAQIQAYARVQASAWMELQMAFGQTKRTDLAGPEFSNSILSFMVDAGGALPVGTTFPNHAVMGVERKWVSEGKASALTVQSVAESSAANLAGIVPGDVIKRVAGKSINNEAGLLDALAKAAKTPTYPVEIVRDGKSMRLTLNRELRPAIAKLDLQLEPATSTSGATSSGPTTSVADELAKFAKLREQGIISADEFEAQKKKLLGQ